MLARRFEDCESLKSEPTGNMMCGLGDSELSSPSPHLLHSSGWSFVSSKVRKKRKPARFTSSGSRGVKSDLLIE